MPYPGFDRTFAAHSSVIFLPSQTTKHKEPHGVIHEERVIYGWLSTPVIASALRNPHFRPGGFGV